MRKWVDKYNNLWIGWWFPGHNQQLIVQSKHPHIIMDQSSSNPGVSFGCLFFPRLSHLVLGHGRRVVCSLATIFVRENNSGSNDDGQVILHRWAFGKKLKQIETLKPSNCASSEWKHEHYVTSSPIQNPHCAVQKQQQFQQVWRSATCVVPFLRCPNWRLGFRQRIDCVTNEARWKSQDLGWVLRLWHTWYNLWCKNIVPRSRMLYLLANIT